MKTITNKLHELKIYPKYFAAVLSGAKTFEIRKNDRNYRVGDTLLLREWDTIKYSGRTIRAEVTYVSIGFIKGYVVLGIKIKEDK